MSKKDLTELPEIFYERLKKLMPNADLYNQVCVALKTGTPTSFRTNTIKTTSAKLKQTLTQSGFEIIEVAWSPGAFVLKNKSLLELTAHPLYEQGHFYVQNLSSMIPPLVLDPQPNESILDLTAAPGSKTTQMATMMNNTGMILANDLSTVRNYKLKANLIKQGVTNTKLWKMPGERLWNQFPEQFDRTLADVPCSMEGRIRLDRPKTFANWSEKRINQLSLRQHGLLRSAISATKVGGIIVYSTCTLAPEENEAVVNWIVKKMPSVVKIMPIEIRNLPISHGLTSWQEQEFHPDLKLTARIYPSSNQEGFYIAKLQKLSTSI